jgi:protein phosphatase PTC2/3
VVVLVRGDVLYVANCGDSRAVLGTLSPSDSGGNGRSGGSSGRGGDDGCIVGVALTEDQTPEVPAERERIQALGGFVSPPPQPGLSSRVW